MTPKQAKSKSHFHIKHPDGDLLPEPYRLASHARGAASIGGLMIGGYRSEGTESKAYRVVSVGLRTMCPCKSSVAAEQGSKPQSQGCAGNAVGYDGSLPNTGRARLRSTRTAKRPERETGEMSRSVSSNCTPKEAHSANGGARSVPSRVVPAVIGEFSGESAACAATDSSSTLRSAEEGGAPKHAVSPRTSCKQAGAATPSEDTVSPPNAAPCLTANGNPSLAHEEANYLNARSGGGIEG